MLRLPAASTSGGEVAWESSSGSARPTGALGRIYRRRAGRVGVVGFLGVRVVGASGLFLVFDNKLAYVLEGSKYRKVLITIRRRSLGTVVGRSRLGIIRRGLRGLSTRARLGRLSAALRLGGRSRSLGLSSRGLRLRSRGRNTGALRRGRRTAIISRDRLADVGLLALGGLRVEAARLASLGEAVAVVLPDADVVGSRALQAVGVVGEETVVLADVGVLTGLDDGLTCGGVLAEASPIGHAKRGEGVVVVMVMVGTNRSCRGSCTRGCRAPASSGGQRRPHRCQWRRPGRRWPRGQQGQT